MTPSLDKLRRQAKSLKRAFNQGEAAAAARVRAVLPDAATTLRHTQALHVIAREQGHESWPRLKLAADLARMDRDARAERLKYALYLGQGWVADDLLRADPDLPAHNLGLQCALYDIEGVRTALARDPGAATRIVGIRSPILHLAFSRHHRAAPDKGEAMIAVAEALVTAGADVNDSYPAEPGSEHRLSALYGALGHAGSLRLAEWLLQNGADPDDNESLYHATELGHLDGVRLLMRHGVRTSGTNALARMLDFDDLDGTRLFLEYGADPNEAVLDHPSGQPIDTIPALHQAARPRRPLRRVASGPRRQPGRHLAGPHRLCPRAHVRQHRLRRRPRRCRPRHGAGSGRGGAGQLRRRPTAGRTAARIVKLAREIGSTKPVFVAQGWSLQRQANGEQAARAVCMLPILTGNIGLPGTNLGEEPGNYAYPVATLPLPENGVAAKLPCFLWTDAIVRGPEMTALADGIQGAERLTQPIKFLWSYASNATINQHSDIARTDAILRDESLCEFILVIENHMTPSARYADVLLPDVTNFESSDIIPNGYAVGELGGPIYLSPAVEPMYECKPVYEICTLLARHLGVEQQFTEGKSFEDWL